MPEPFKNLINDASMTQVADALFNASPAFPRDAFLAAALPGLDALELKGRVRHVAAALRANLPDDWDAALALMLAGMGPPLPSDEGVGDGFRYWPLLTVVEEYGLETPDASMAALREMTKRFSAEFAIRPYIIRYPDTAYATLTRWCDDPNLHVRRLVSEGSRPRLPWGQQITSAVADPARGLALLERLVDAPERYVQRSVANHLNDIAKDHPDKAAAVARRWSAVDGRAWTVKHGLRTLLKQGHPGALSVLGFAPPKLTVTGLIADPSRVTLGGSVTLRAKLTSTATVPQKLMLDIAVGFVKKDGRRSPKVFKGSQKTLAPGASWAFSKTIPLKKVTTRRHYAGRHTLTLQVNGKAMGTVGFQLSL